MRSRVLVFVPILGPFLAFAQLDVPVRLILNAPVESERHVSGLAAPTSRDAGVSLGSSRELSTTWAIGTGTSIISADLIPAPPLYSVGMTVTILPTSANEANAQLDLNGLGDAPIRTMDGLLLDSAVIQPDVPVRFVFDGQSFLLLSEATIPCKSGYTAVSVDLCIKNQSNDTATFFEAAEHCAAKGSRLCRYGEWIGACRRIFDFMNTVPEMEWVDSAGNNVGDAKTVGVGFDGQTLIEGAGCGYGSTVPALSYARYRCCSNR